MYIFVDDGVAVGELISFSLKRSLSRLPRALLLNFFITPIGIGGEVKGFSLIGAGGRVPIILVAAKVTTIVGLS